jgi:O-antigen/teichoic acid export membrane protein
MKSLFLLAAGSLTIWALLLGAGWLVSGDDVLLPTSVALGLCLIPALGTLVWIQQGKKSVEMQLAAILGSGGVRMGMALGGGLALTYFFPDAFPTSFLLWIGAMYMGVLTLETVLIFRFRPNEDARKA